MKAKSRFQETRLFLGAGTVAVLLGTWSALTVHDIQTRDAGSAAALDTTTNVATAPERAPVTTSSQTTTSTPSRQTTTVAVPHTRTRAS